MKTLFRLLPFVALTGLLTSNSCKKKSDTTTITPDSGPYFAKVKTIIQNNCYSCHLSTGSWAGRPTAFDTDSMISTAYASIKASVADPATFVNKPMPQGGALSTSDINIIVSWYGKGGRTTD